MDRVADVAIVFFLQPYSSLLLELYGGAWLSDGEGPLLLRTYAVYVNFDMICDPLYRTSQLHFTPHRPCTTLCLAPMQTGC